MIPCGKCIDPVFEVERHLCCYFCNSSFHLGCTKFKDVVYSVIDLNNCFDDIMWRCDFCKGKAEPKFYSNSSLFDMITNLQLRLSNLEKGVTASSDNIPASTQSSHSSK